MMGRQFYDYNMPLVLISRWILDLLAKKEIVERTESVSLSGRIRHMSMTGRASQVMTR